MFRTLCGLQIRNQDFLVDSAGLYQSSQLLTLMAGFHELAGVILLTT
jgi:hypothetical protein